MHRTVVLNAAMVALFTMAACSSGDARSSRPQPVFSPNGEVLSTGGRGAPKCLEALGGWWDQLAAANGGVIGKDVFIADAEAQFAAMDLDHDGFITPSELSEYRAGAGEPIVEAVPPPGPDGRTQNSSDNTGGGGRRNANAPPPPRPGRIPPDVVDPVMSADKSLSFKVSHSDFMTQAEELFTELDKNRDGRIDREELLASCRKN